MNQSSSKAASAQNASGSSMLRWYISAYWAGLETWALAAKSLEGGKTRFSRRREEKFWGTAWSVMDLNILSKQQDTMITVNALVRSGRMSEGVAGDC